ncbi:MAG: valine--tRNA ligase, partial [Armatimonadota bacterium]
LVGQKVRLPLMDRVIPVITDSQVDPEFGTGAVKITPAHDPNDFEIGRRHNLEQVVVIGLDGLMTEVAGRFACMSREDCREKVLEALREEGLLVKTEAHMHAVGTCSRCHTAIEPLVSEQWFVKSSELAKAGIEAVRSGRIRFVPERWTKVYLDWMEGIRDWCISRQLWWGHRIPVFYCEGCDHEFAAREAPEKCPECGFDELRQDPDVLDTWFSSGLWPISTMGWPEETPELDYFHPSTVLVTAYDIITFWVSRMIMMDLYLTGQVPFTEVFIHGLVRDARGRKMSKSEGNVIDPRAAMDEYGTDAVRFALMSLISHGQDIAVTPDRFVGARNFCNKLWNAARLVITNLDGEGLQPPPDDALLELADRWILARRDAAVADVTRHLESYDLADAARRIYQFVWDEFCDWYLEMAKLALYGYDEQRRSVVRAVLATVLRDILKLLHPFTPFITEEIWQTLHGGRKRPHGADSLAVQPWPEAGERPDADAVQEAMDTLQAVVRGARNLRSIVGLAPSREVEAIVTAPDDDTAALLRREESHVRNLAALSDVQFRVGEPPEAARALPAVAAGVHVLVKVPDDVDVKREMDKLNAQLARLSRELESSEKKLANEKFVERAPAEVVAKERGRQQELSEQKAKLQERIGLLETL